LAARGPFPPLDLEPIQKPLTPSPSPRKRGEGSWFWDSLLCNGADDIDAKWQLLARPLGADEFTDLPYLRGLFFDHGLRLATRMRRVTAVGDSVEFAVIAPPQIELMVKLTTSDGAESEKDVYELTTAVPRGGRVRLNAKNPAGGTSYTTLIDFTPQNK